MAMEQAELTIWQTEVERLHHLSPSLRSPSPNVLGVAFGVTIRLASMRDRYLVAHARLAILLE
jgi:hypothetical protein